MSRAINIFTSLVFVYSFIVCITCKQVSPAKVGSLNENYTKIKIQDDLQGANLNKEALTLKNKRSIATPYLFISTK